MTSLGRVGRILAGTIDVTNSVADKDTQSSNASTVDCNVVTATTSNTTTTMSSMAGDGTSSERKAKSTASSCNLNDSSTSSNDNTSNNAMILQGTSAHSNTKPIDFNYYLLMSVSLLSLSLFLSIVLI